MTVLKELEKKHKLKPVEMAQVIGISKSYYSMLRSGERPISKNVAIQLRQQFGIMLDDSLCPAVHEVKTNDDQQKPQLPRTG